jgi:hypothetical protein
MMLFALLSAIQLAGMVACVYLTVVNHMRGYTGLTIACGGVTAFWTVLFVLTADAHWRGVI